MSNQFLLRALASAVFSAVLASTFLPRAQKRIAWRRQVEGRPLSQRQPGFLLPIACLLPWVLLLARKGALVPHVMLSWSFGIFLHICVYYLLLLPFLPWLRQRFSAEACAALWLLPTYLYVINLGFLQSDRPRWVITLRAGWTGCLPYIWLAGFLAVLGWKLADHLLFRRRVMADARPVDDRFTETLWRRAVIDAHLDNFTVRLFTSSHVSAPVSIGLLRRSLLVVLPRDAVYTAEELELIFRHELVHIERRDTWTKFFLVFCCAMCWFNPLMWVAMDKSAQDMELSCDELVLKNAGNELRQKYARLLLNTAGSSRGFTSCLSSSAQALRHRLKHVMEPLRRRSGALLLGAVCFVLFITSGYVSLAYGAQSGAEVLYPGDINGGGLKGNVALSAEDGGYHYFALSDTQPLQDYLSTLTLYRMTGSYALSESEKVFQCWLRVEDGTSALAIHDQILSLASVNSSGIGVNTHYYLPDGVDWAYLSDLIVSGTKSS